MNALPSAAGPGPVGVAPVLKPAMSALGSAFYASVSPTPLPQPHWVARSLPLARELGLDEEWLRSEDALLTFTGNRVPEGTHTRASVYSGHQFGNWAGQLGDGRALLLGELDTPQGTREIQLKGAGLTPFSRMGDGRAVLRSSIREFLCSEAMHALGIPTTRALCITGSPQPVRRETIETAAVVTRTAPSFIRFGHFEHFSYGDRHDELRRLADHVIDRFYPACRDTANSYATLLQAVSERTAHLMAQWQAVGFCHGVMNTDNMSILGLTLDYGPFQFMDGFNPDHICNHTDTGGRYAYNRQPQVAYWNLFCLGQAMLPLIGEPDDAMAALESYKTVFPAALTQRMAAKLGLSADHPHAKPLIDSTLHMLAAERTDYPLFWHRLSGWLANPAEATPLHDLFADRSRCDAWMKQFQEHTSQHHQAPDANLASKNNPKYVLRNHLAQTAIAQAERGDVGMVAELLSVLHTPFAEHPAHESWAALPPDWAAHIEISCSS
jgi:serine/tyrosine/threonine adenylyltransferase